MDSAVATWGTSACETIFAAANQVHCPTMLPAQEGHNADPRENLVVHVSCEVVHTSGSVRERPFLAFSQEELEMLAASDPFDLMHALVCVFGCSGKLYLQGSDHAVYDPDLPLTVNTAWVFEPDVHQSGRLLASTGIRG
jgi:hypothetical protein